MKKGTIATLSTLFGAASGAVSVFTRLNKTMKKERELDRKNDAILKVYNQWFKTKAEGRTIADYFSEEGYHNIAIYGMHYLGESLCLELENTDITVKYAIDKNADEIYSDIDIFTPDEELEEVDAVIVTAFFYFDEIQEHLSKVLDCPIISFKDVLYEI